METSSDAAAQQLLAGLQAAADQSGPATASSLFQLQCRSTHPGGSAQLTGQLMLPDALITITPLYNKRISSVPLSEALRQQLPAGSTDMGYLSMDQARSLVPLYANDSLVRNKHCSATCGLSDLQMLRKQGAGMHRF